MRIPRSFQPGREAALLRQTAAAAGQEFAGRAREAQATASIGRSIATTAGDIALDIAEERADDVARTAKAEEAADLTAATVEGRALSRALLYERDPLTVADDDELAQYGAQLDALAEQYGRTPESRQAIERSFASLADDTTRQVLRTRFTRARTAAIDETSETFRLAIADNDLVAAQGIINTAQEAGLPRELLDAMRKDKRELSIRQDFEQQLAQGYEQAAEFIQSIAGMTKLTEEEQSALSRSLSAELARAQKLDALAEQDARTTAEADAVLATGEFQRGIAQGEPITEQDLAIARDSGVLGADEVTAARRFNQLAAQLTRQDSVAADVDAILNNLPTRPAPASAPSGRASDAIYQTNLDAELPPEEAAAATAAQTGRVPPAVESQIQAFWRGGNAAGVQRSLQLYASVVQRSPEAVVKLDKDTRVLMDAGYDLLMARTGDEPYDYDEADLAAVAAQLQAMTEVSPDVRAAREDTWREVVRNFDDYLGELRDETVPGTGVWGFFEADKYPELVEGPEALPGLMRDQLLQNAEVRYLATGDRRSALTGALRETLNEWTLTDLNANAKDFNGDDMGPEWQFRGVRQGGEAGLRSAFAREAAELRLATIDGIAAPLDEVALRPTGMLTVNGEPTYSLTWRGEPLYSNGALVGPWYPE